MHDKRGQVEVSVGANAEVQATAADEELNVSKEERVRIGRGDGVFTGAHEEVETDDHHVGTGEDERSRAGFGEGGRGSQLKEADGDGFHARGRRIGATVGTQLVVQTEVDRPERVQARVRGPQEGARLAHVTEGSINRRSVDGSATFGGLTSADAMREDLEQGNGVVDVGEKGIHGQGLAEGLPDGPGAIGGVMGGRNDAGSHRVERKAEVSDESMAGGGGRHVQGVAGG